MRRALAWLALTVALSAACGGGASGPSPAPGWRVELPGAHPLALATLPDGRVVSAWAILAATTIGAQRVTPRGHGDLVFLVQTADGAIAAVHRLDLDDPGIINATELVVDGERVIAAVLTDTGFAVGGARVEAVAQPPDQVLPAMSFTLVTLDLAAGPIAAVPIHAGVPNGSNRLALVPGGDLIVTGEIFSRETPTITVIQRVASTGEVRWERRLEINDASALTVAADGAIAFGGDGGLDWIAVVALDAAGAERWRCRVERVGTGVGDLLTGGVSALRLEGDTVHAVADLAGSYRLAGATAPRSPLRTPFAFDCAAGGIARVHALAPAEHRATTFAGGDGRTVVARDDPAPGRDVAVSTIDVAAGARRLLATAAIVPEHARVTADGGVILLGRTADDRDAPGCITRVVPR